MDSITQDMKYRQSLIHYAMQYGVSRAGRKTTKAGRTSTSGSSVTTGALNPSVHDPSVRIPIPASTRKLNSSSLRICGGETQGSVSLSSGSGSETEGIPAGRKVCTG